MVIFPVILFDAPQNSSYSSFGSQICQVTPLVTTVQTTYDQTGIINVIQPPLAQYLLPDPNITNHTGALMWFPAFAIWSSLVRSQGLTANMYGDNLLVFQQPYNMPNYTSIIVCLNVVRFFS